ncbi:MAG: hypothetical protein ACHBN1_26520 [Heteroscytonema crispum UTEX LB 1556]
MARPQDRSGSPTKGAPSPTPNTQQPNGRTSYLRECYPPAVRASPTTNNPRGVHQSPGSGKRHCDPWPDPKTAVAPLPRAPLHQHPTTND